MTLSTPESSIWHHEDGTRLSEIPEITAAARNLGQLTMSIVDDFDEAYQIKLELARAYYKKIYPEIDDDEIEELAALDADYFVRNMKPLPGNGNDPLRLVRISSTDGSPVKRSTIYEEIKYRVKPVIQGDGISAKEVIHSILNPVDPEQFFEQ